MVGESIKRERIKAGLTYEQLAELVGSKKDSIYRYETGKKNPSMPLLEKICEVLNCTIELKPKKKP